MTVNIALIQPIEPIKTDKHPEYSGLNVFTFKLTATPNHDWIEVFDQYYKHWMSSTHRPASIRGNTIVIECAVDELKSVLLEIHNRFCDTNTTINDAYTKHEALRQAEAAELARRATAAKEALKNLKLG